MSEEETPEVEKTDKELNFEKLREKNEALEAKLAELAPVAVNETVRSVGLDPNEGNGLVLKDLLGDDASEERAQELVAKYGWEVSESDQTPDLSKEERAAQEFATRKAELDSVTHSDEPPQDLAKQIDEAEAAAARGEGDWAQVTNLKLQQFQRAAEQRGL